jgi:hypothetical protein
VLEDVLSILDACSYCGPTSLQRTLLEIGNFDLRVLLQTEGLSEKTGKAFLVYLISRGPRRLAADWRA